MLILPFAVPAAVAAGIYLIRKQREYAWGMLEHLLFNYEHDLFIFLQHLGWNRNNNSLRGKIYIVTGSNTGKFLAL